MRIEFARGPLDGSTLSIEKHELERPIFREFPNKPGKFALYKPAGYKVLRYGGSGKPARGVPVFEYVTWLSGAEMQESLERAGTRVARIIRAD